MLTRNSQASGTALVCGGFVLINAMVQAAHDVGLHPPVPVFGNGNALPGPFWHALSQQAQALLTQSDRIIAKGQGNFETLSKCSLNIFFLLLCMGDFLVRRFRVPRRTGLLNQTRRMPEPVA